MFKIYNKTMQELIEEVEASRKMSPRKNISTTFIVDRKRGKISTSDLTEEDILSLVIEDIKDFFIKFVSSRTTYLTFILSKKSFRH